VPVSGGQAEHSPAAIAATYLGGLVSGRGLRLGPRTSPMAMAQAHQVAGLLGSLVPDDHDAARPGPRALQVTGEHIQMLVAPADRG
jgi:hypothetical protein